MYSEFGHNMMLEIGFEKVVDDIARWPLTQQ